MRSKHLHVELCDRSGWIAPDGSYYPCVGDPIYGENHRFTAETILARYYPEQDLREIRNYGISGVQEWLVKNGWIRTDIEWTWMPEKPTAGQINTLKVIVATPESDLCGVNRTEIQGILAQIEAGTFIN